MRVLIIKPTAFGDVAQALRPVAALKHSGWATRLDWIVDSDYLPLVQACPAVDRAIPFPRRRWRASFCPGEMLQWIRQLRQQTYDVALDLQGLARSALMIRAARAARRIGLSSAREGARWAVDELVPDHPRHAIDRYLVAIRHLIARDPAPFLQPIPRPAAALPAGLTPGSYILLHPYSLWTTKLWPWENFSTLCSLRPEVHFVAIGHGPRFPLSAPNLTDLRGRLPLDTLLPLLAHARAIVSTDSGPAHAAALFDTPVLAVFGATDPERTAPRSTRTTVLMAEDLPCRPCLSRNCHHPQPLTCLTSLNPPRIAAALDALIA